MAEIILAPTAQSKVIPLSIRLNDTDTSLVSQLVTNRQFSTADTDAWFSLTLEGLAATTGTFDLTLINLQDKSVFNHTDKVFSTNPFYYKLDSGTDELTNEIRHAGKWVGQLVVTLANGDSATRKFIFGIEGHILDGTVVQTILLEDYNALIASIESAKDELTQYNIDYSTLISTVESQEAARVQAELTREQTFNALVDGEIIAQNVATELQNIEATYAPRLLSAEQQLADKAEQTDVVDSLFLKRDKSTKIQLSDFSDGAIDAIAGTSAVIGYVADNSLDVKKVNWWEVQNENLLNPVVKTTGYINGDGTVNTSTGNLFQLIPVIPGETYITTGTLYDSGYYDEANVFVSAHPKTTTFTVPAGVHRLSISYASWDESIMLVKGTVYPTTTIPYGVFDLSVIDANFKNMLDKNTKAYVDANTTDAFIQKRVNLLDQTVMEFGYINGSGGIQANADCKVSDFIAVEEGKTYITPTSWDSGYYGINENFVQLISGAGGIFTVPTGLNIKKLRVAIPTYALTADTMLVCADDYNYDAGFVPYSDYWLDYAFSDSRLSLLRSKLRNLKWNNIGDSIANSSTGYRILVPSQTGIKLTNYAVDGASYAPKTGQTMVISDQYITMADDADIITVHAGVNDVSGGIAIGTMADSTNATFMGALHITYAGLIAKYPGKKIGIITPIQRIDNQLLIPYVNAIKEVAAFYGIPCLDLNANCGLHPDIPAIKDAYYDSIGLHPTQNGHRIFTPRIINFLESL